jgi:hypothetical protein
LRYSSFQPLFHSVTYLVYAPSLFRDCPLISTKILARLFQRLFSNDTVMILQGLLSQNKLCGHSIKS